MTKCTIWLDTEARSRLDLKKVGTGRWTGESELLLLAFAVDDGPVHVVDYTRDRPPEYLSYLFNDDQTEIVAHNALFDRLVLRHAGIDIPAHRWRCTAAQAQAHALPPSLDKLGRAMGLVEDDRKVADGKRLVRMFCMPQPRGRKRAGAFLGPDDRPHDWAEFVEYCRQDVHTMRECARLMPNWNYPTQELQYWHLDQKINERGVPVDIEAARAVIRAIQKRREELDSEVDYLTLGAVTSATQIERIRIILEGYQVRLDNLTKTTVEAALKGDLPRTPRRLLEIRREVGKTSTAKFEKIVAAATPSRDWPNADVIADMFRYCGAGRSGRYASQMVQLQNLPSRGLAKADPIIALEAFRAGAADLIYDDMLQQASACIRPVIVAPAGKALLVSDYSNIEGRITAWLCGEAWKVQAFRDFDAGTGPDLYKLSYSRSFRVPVDEVTKDQRFIGKVQELALGYGGGVGAFTTMARAYGVEIEEARAEAIKLAWRREHPRITAAWRNLEYNVRMAIKNPRQARRSEITGVDIRTVPHQGRRYLCLRLPSRRVLTYADPNIDADGQVSYRGWEQLKSGGRSWVRVNTWGGKLLENVVQAIARDILVHGIAQAEYAGLQVIGSVHDEILALAPAGADIALLNRAMTDAPPWATTLPLAVEGFVTERYRK